MRLDPELGSAQHGRRLRSRRSRIAPRLAAAPLTSSRRRLRNDVDSSGSTELAPNRSTTGWRESSQLSTAGRRSSHLRSVFIVTVALLLFYFPTEKLPPWRYWNKLFPLPAVGSSSGVVGGLWQLLHFDTIVILGLFVFCGSSLLLGPLSRSGRRIRSVIGWVTLLLVTGGLLSLSDSQYPGVSLADLIGICGLLLLAILITLSRPTIGEIRWWVRSAVGGTSVIMLAGVVTFYQSFGIPSPFTLINAHFLYTTTFAGYERVTYGNGAQTDEVIMLVLPLTLYLLVARSTDWRDRMLFAVASILLVANLLITFERFALLSLGVIGILICVRLTRVGYLRTAASTIAIFATAILVSSNYLLTDSRVAFYLTGAITDTNQADSLRVRPLAWHSAINVILKSPWGIGFQMNTLDPDLPYAAAHNLFLGLAVTGGILAMVAAIVWSIWLLRNFIAALVSEIPSAESDLAFALQLCPIGYLLYTIVEDGLTYQSGIGVWIAYWFIFPILGMVLQARLVTGDESTTSRNLPSRFAARRAGLRGLSRVSIGQVPP